MTVMDRRSFLALTGAAALSPVSDFAFAANWPERPVTVISPYPAGGGSDTVARIVADALRGAFNQNFVVENRPGAAGAIGGGFTARANADGYTLLISASSPLAAAKLVQEGLTYDPQTDFTPISLVGETPLVLIASPKLGVSSLKELIAYGKANPGKLDCGNAGSGAKGHIAAAILARMTGVELNHVPYKGSAPLVGDLLGGHMTFAIDTLATYLPYIEDGRLRALGVTSANRVQRVPNVPTVAEQGVDGYDATLWYGVVGPRGLPDDIVLKISKAIKSWIDMPATKDRFAQLSITPIGGTPQDLKRAMDLEINSLKPIVESGALVVK